MERLKLDAPSMGGYLDSLGATKQLSLPSVSIRWQPTLGCLGSVHFPWSYVGRQVTQKITLLGKLTVTSPSHSCWESPFWGQGFRGSFLEIPVGWSLICIHVPNINGLSVPEPLTAILNIPLVDQVSFLTVFNLSPSSLVQIPCLLARPPSCWAYINIHIFPFMQTMENLSKSPSKSWEFPTEYKGLWNYLLNYQTVSIRKVILLM